jgi:hypothetical protein
VDTVIIDGQVVMEGRKLVTMEERAILDMAHEWGQSLRRRSLHSSLYHPEPPKKGQSLS